MEQETITENALWVTCFHAFIFFLLGSLDAPRIQGGVLEDTSVTCAICELSVTK